MTPPRALSAAAAVWSGALPGGGQGSPGRDGRAVAANRLLFSAAGGRLLRARGSAVSRQTPVYQLGSPLPLPGGGGVGAMGAVLDDDDEYLFALSSVGTALIDAGPVGAVANCCCPLLSPRAGPLPAGCHCKMLPKDSLDV